MLIRGYAPIIIKEKKYAIFNFIELPAVAMRNIILQMSIEEIIKLAVCSKRIERCVKHARPKTNSYEIELAGHRTRIVAIDEDVTIHCYKYASAMRAPKLLTVNEMLPWMNLKEKLIQNTSNMFQRLRSLIRCKSYAIIIDLSLMGSNSVKEILEVTAFRKCEKVMLWNGKIETKDFDLVMEMAQDEREIQVDRTEIPSDYFHENAFKFGYTDYEDARWVRIEYLFSLKDRHAVLLGRNNLNTNDANIFMKHWVDNDHDMVRFMEIVFNEGMRFQPEVLFDGLVVLKAFRLGFRFYLIAANPDKSRKQPVLSLHKGRTELCLKSYSPTDPVQTRDGNGDPFSREYQILLILNNKKNLEEELKELENEGQLIELVVKKEKLVEEIRKLTNELNENGVFFTNGMAVIE